jgi:hypothetical protein
VLGALLCVALYAECIDFNRTFVCNLALLLCLYVCNYPLLCVAFRATLIRSVAIAMQVALTLSLSVFVLCVSRHLFFLASRDQN